MSSEDRSKRVESLGVYEMQWNCKYCGTEKLLGKTHRFCPNCGAAQDPAARYFPSDEEKIAVQDHEFYGADFICSACDTPNSGNSHNCRQCGASLETAQRAGTLGDQLKAQNASFVSSGPRDIEKERHDAEMQRLKASEKKGPNWLVIGIIGIVVLIIGIIAVTVLWKREAVVYAVGHTWTREIFIEAYGPESDSAWCDSMPSAAYNVTRRQEQRSTNRVQDGEECSVRRVDTGDGTFREQRECQPTYREEPVYDNKCYFTIDRWSPSRSVVANGASMSDAPYWPELNIRNSGTCIGCEREANRDEQYLVQFENREENQTYECAVDESRWRSIQTNSTWKLQISVVTGGPDCSTLESAAR